MSYTNATLTTTVLNLIPGFTFVLAVLCRMEPVDLSSTTMLKFIGVVVSITGAIIMTLYKGPAILSSPLKSEISRHLLVQPSDWVLGGILVAISSIFLSVYMIVQATLLRLYPEVTIVMFAYFFVCTILSALASLILENDLSAFSLKSKIRLFSILYSGIFGIAFQRTVQAWGIRKRGPLFVAMFQPVGIVISAFIGVVFLGDGLDLGSLLGSFIVVIGFYDVMWEKAKESIMAVKSGGISKLYNEEAPLLQDIDVVEEHIITSPSP